MSKPIGEINGFIAGLFKSAVVTFPIFAVTFIGWATWATKSIIAFEKAIIYNENAIAINRQQRIDANLLIAEKMNERLHSRWSVTHMQIWSGELERLNAAKIQMPDVRKIVRENEP